MNVTRLEKLYIGGLSVVFGLIVLHAPLSVGLGVLFPDWGLLIKSWKEIIMLGLVPVGVVLVSKRELWKQLANDWIFWLIIAYTTLHVVLTIALFQGLASTVAGLAIDLRHILFFSLVYVAIKILPHYRHIFLQVGIVGAFIVVGFATLQLFLPPDFLKLIGYSNDTIAPYLTVDKNPDYIRVNSTLRGPNPLGAYVGIVLGLLAAALAKGRLKLQNRYALWLAGVLGVCGIVALWISYSRSALVAGVITVSIVLVVAMFHKISRRAWIISTALVFAFVGGVVAARETPFISNVLFHENQNGGSDISSNDDHVESLEYGVAQTLRQPLGVGVGSTGSASLFGDKPVIVENQYLFIAHETGWLGLGLFISLFVVVLRRLWRLRQEWLPLGVFASGVGLSLIGLLLPVWVDDTVSIVWWGLAAIAIAGGEYGRKQTK